MMRAAWGSRRDAVLAYLAEPRTKQDLLKWGGPPALHCAWWLKKTKRVECRRVSHYVWLWQATAKPDTKPSNDGGAALMAVWSA